jgi:hypothetical protein
LSFDQRAIEIRLNTSSMYARTIASAASPGKLASVDDLIRAESLQIVAFLLGRREEAKGESVASLGNTGNANASHLRFHIMDGPTAPRFWEAMGCPM